jgi:hypothetical protein
MNTAEKTQADGNHYEVLDLLSYKCPSCHMLTWHAKKSKAEISCPFCSHNLPQYVTKLSADRMVRTHEPLSPSSWRLDAEDDRGVSPFILEFFMVQGIGFRCMAYRNGDGKWHEAFNDRELPGAIRLLE